MSETSAPAPWTAAEPTVIGPGQTVTRYTHPSGAIVDDNRENVPADLAADLSPAQLAELIAETAFVGHTATGGHWEEFATFAEAAAYALGGTP